MEKSQGSCRRKGECDMINEIIEDSIFKPKCHQTEVNSKSNNV